MSLLLGIDTGGTYTDAVLFDDEKGVVRTAKALTTKHDLALGIAEAARGVLPERPQDVSLVSISTTLATNAIVEGRGAPVCLLMVGQGRDALRRSDLGSALKDDPVEFIDGGHDATGEEQAPLDLDRARHGIEQHARRVAAFAIAAQFAVRNPVHEVRLRQLVGEICGAPVTCSHELSDRLDAPRRALTSVLNARLVPLITQLIEAVRTMMRAADLSAPLMVVKGDGSLVKAEVALARPVETVLSGPAASMVGARHLAGIEDFLVVDMGGTTTDIAVLDRGRPRLREDGASVGGWRTMVRAVAAHTVGLGGDSEVSLVGNGSCRVGPRRAVPMCLLASRQPEVLEMLRARREKMLYSEDQIRLVIPIGSLGRRLETGSRFERELCESLASGPQWVSEVAPDLVLKRVLERLIRHDVLAIAGFTPTDAAHVLGRHQTWSTEGARRAGELWLQLARYEFGFRGETVESLSESVTEAVVRAAARASIDAALAHEGVGVDVDSAAGQSLIDRALHPRAPGPDRGSDPSSDPNSDGEIVTVAVGLRRPLIAVGAPAASYYPEVADRLNAELYLPDHGEVANAVGAVATGVMQIARILITSPSEGCYRVHGEGGLEDFAEYAESEARAYFLAEQMARERAQIAGAQQIAIEKTQEDLRATGGDGRAVFVETTVTATAVGRPALAESQS